MKKLLKSIVIIIIVAFVAFGGLLGFLTITDYDPEPIESVELISNQTNMVELNTPMTFYSWNIGYCGLGSEEDFFMDDGTKARADSEEVVTGYVNGVLGELEGFDADFIMLQEIDVESKRSYYVNEKDLIDESLDEYSNSFAKNYDVKFVPVPVPPLGKVYSGIGSYSKYNIDSVTRYALPGEYEWPTKVAMLDRCMLVSRIPIEGSDAELVAVNAHFSAYDDGSIRAQQLAFIKEFVVGEYDKGNYVVLGGDWNQTFPGVEEYNFPLYQNGEYWLPQQIEDDWIDSDWSFGYGSGAPTYRLLNEPYNEGFTQTGIIDGFLVSPNVKLVSSEVVDLGFEYSDHNPVVVEVILVQ